MYVIKKDGRKQVYDPNKIIIAINKSADRALYTFTDKEIQKILELVTTQLHSMQDEVSVLTMHSLVENALDEVAPTVAKSYRDYRNFKNEYDGPGKYGSEPDPVFRRQGKFQCRFHAGIDKTYPDHECIKQRTVYQVPVKPG